MAARQKYPLLNLRHNDYEVAEREPSGRRIIEGKISIDYSCFKKDSREKLLIKCAKAQYKLDQLKRKFV